jgi:site-specific DNA recombinase
VARHLDAASVGPEAIATALDRAGRAAEAMIDAPSAADDETRATSFLHRIDLGEASLRIHMNLALLLDRPEVEQVLAAPFEVPITLQRSGRNRPIALRAETGAPKRDPDLIALVADARRWMEDLIRGRAASVAEITEREQLRPGNVSRILPLAWLAPDIAKAILEGRQPADLTAKRLRALPELPLEWSTQRRLLGFPTA